MTKETYFKDASDSLGRTCETEEWMSEERLRGGPEGWVWDEALGQEVEERGGPAVWRSEGRGAARCGEEDRFQLVLVVVRGLAVGHFDDDAAEGVHVDCAAVGPAPQHLWGHPVAGSHHLHLRLARLDLGALAEVGDLDGCLLYTSPSPRD